MGAGARIEYLWRLCRALMGVAAAAIALLGATEICIANALTAVQQDPGNVAVKLEPVVTLNGFAPIDAATRPGSSHLYVGTYEASDASVQIVDPVTKTIAPVPFLTFAGTGVPIAGQGLQGIAFSPNFNDISQPGYRKFYTYQSEIGAGGANTMFVHPEVANPTTVGVLREWTANAPGTAIDMSIPSRVVLNFGTPGGHMGGGLKFGPDGFLYLATGDGGGNGNGGSTSNNSDGFTGRNPDFTSLDVPGISNGEDFTNALGKVLRIDPYVTNGNGSPRATPEGATAKAFGGSTRYFIPADNPFVDNPQNIYFTPIGPASEQSPVAPLEELYAFGFRNPWKLSFDKNAEAGARPIVADVGSRDREEIIVVDAGQNYGWPYREGDLASGAANGRPLVAGNLPYLKQTTPGVFLNFDLDPTLSDPAQMAIPTARLGTRSGTSNPLVFYDRPGNDLYNDGVFGPEYSDTSSVVGGFIYRGSAIPELEGMYVFGGFQFLIPDPTQNPSSYRATSAGGKLYYFDPEEDVTYKTVHEFNFEAGFGIANVRIPGTTSNVGDLLSVAQGTDGELYAMFLNGDIKRIAPTTLEGDYNNDNTVDAADYTIWRNNLGSTTANLPNDLTPTLVDESDYTAWRANYGATRGGLGGGGLNRGATVPEPAAAFHAVLAALITIAQQWFGRARRS